MLESKVEEALNWLKQFGFDVLKLKTPGTSGVMDRMILQPKWSPSSPCFVEIKRPGKAPRPLQAAVAADWKARGCDVLEYCDTIEKVEKLCYKLVIEAVWRLKWKERDALPKHIKDAYASSLGGITK